MQIKKGLSVNTEYWKTKKQSEFVDWFKDRGVRKEILIKVYKQIKKGGK